MYETDAFAASIIFCSSVFLPQCIYKFKIKISAISANSSNKTYSSKPCPYSENSINVVDRETNITGENLSS